MRSAAKLSVWYIEAFKKVSIKYEGSHDEFSHQGRPFLETQLMCKNIKCFIEAVKSTVVVVESRSLSKESANIFCRQKQFCCRTDFLD